MMDYDRYGANSFWEMAAATIAGGLASCESCVEFFYFQSYQNARAFLDSCAAGGLVEKISLLDLRAEIGEEAPPLLRSWYDQAIYISAPIFRNKNLDAARGRVESTKNAVYNALHLYHELVGANDEAIAIAYDKAIDGEKLRNSTKARERRNVDLSPIAKLRLILDGNRKEIETRCSTASNKEVETQAIDATVEFVFGFAGQGGLPSDADRPIVSDRAEELEEFIVGFLDDPSALEKFWKKEYGKMPEGYHLQLLPVVSELARYRYDKLKDAGVEAKASRLIASIREKIRLAQEAESVDEDYLVALSEFCEDMDILTAEWQSQPPISPAADLTRHDSGSFVRS